MKLKDKLTVKCSDDKVRTGQVYYIHPDGIFYIVQFNGFRETFYFDRSAPEKHKTARKRKGER